MPQRIQVQQENDKVWLDLDQLYPPKHKHPNTVFKSLAIVLNALGSDVTYEELMGISGSAFRIQLHNYWCPSSPHPDCGFNCTMIAEKALSLDAASQTFIYRKANKEIILNQIIASINKGFPVLASSFETGIVIGYIRREKETILLYREPYSNCGDQPESSKILPARYTIFHTAPRKPTRQSYLDAIQIAVQLASSSMIDEYRVGFHAWEKWISELVDDAKIKKLQTNGEPELSNQNAHIFYSLLDARQCAVQYLRYVAGISNHEVHLSLEESAVYYSQVVEILEKGMESIVWDWEYTKGKKWTKPMRRNQADILQEAMNAERKGIAEIRSFLASER